MTTRHGSIRVDRYACPRGGVRWILTHGPTGRLLLSVSSLEDLARRTWEEWDLLVRTILPAPERDRALSDLESFAALLRGDLGAGVVGELLRSPARRVGAA